MYKKHDNRPTELVREWIDASRNGESVRSLASRYDFSEWTIRAQFRKQGFVPPTWIRENLSPIDASWIAAVIDCEGTLSIHTPWNKQRGNRNIQTFARVSMVDACVPERLQRLCGGSFRGPITRINKPNYRPFYFWNITSNGLRWLLPQIIPYLMIKKRNAEILVEILSKNRRGVGGQMSFDELYKLVSELRSYQKAGFPPNFENIRGTK